MSSRQVRFTREQLRAYFLTDFASGKDFAPAYGAYQLVETAREGGVFVQMDYNGAPILKAEFVDYLDATNDCDISHAKILGVVMGMRSLSPTDSMAEDLNHFYAALHWLAFARREGKTQDDIAARYGVSDRTVRHWLDKALKHVEKQLKPPMFVSLVMLPEPIYDVA